MQSFHACIKQLGCMMLSQILLLLEARKAAHGHRIPKWLQDATEAVTHNRLK